VESRSWDEVRKRRLLLADEEGRAHLRLHHGAALVQAIWAWIHRARGGLEN